MNIYTKTVAWLPHTGLFLPNVSNTPEYNALIRDSVILADFKVNELYPYLPNKIISHYSRFVVDLERYLDDSMEVMASKGMGYLYNRLIDGTTFDRSVFGAKEYFTQFYKDYHALLAKSLESIGEGAILLDLHSFNPHPIACDLDQKPNRPDICIGFNEDNTKPKESALKVITDYLTEQGLKVGYNTPFSGSMTANTKVKYTSLMIEINKKCYLSNNDISAEGYKLASHLQQALKLFIEQTAL